MHLEKILEDHHDDGDDHVMMMVLARNDGGAEWRDPGCDVDASQGFGSQTREGRQTRQGASVCF